MSSSDRARRSTSATPMPTGDDSIAEAPPAAAAASTASALSIAASVERSALTATRSRSFIAATSAARNRRRNEGLFGGWAWAASFDTTVTLLDHHHRCSGHAPDCPAQALQPLERSCRLVLSQCSFCVREGILGEPHDRFVDHLRGWKRGRLPRVRVPHSRRSLQPPRLGLFRTLAGLVSMGGAVTLTLVLTALTTEPASTPVTLLTVVVWSVAVALLGPVIARVAVAVLDVPLRLFRVGGHLA